MRFVIRLFGTEVFSVQVGRTPVSVQEVLDSLDVGDDTSDTEVADQPPPQPELRPRYVFGFGRG